MSDLNEDIPPFDDSFWGTVPDDEPTLAQLFLVLSRGDRPAPPGLNQEYHRLSVSLLLPRLRHLSAEKWGRAFDETMREQIVDWLVTDHDLDYGDALHLSLNQVVELLQTDRQGRAGSNPSIDSDVPLPPPVVDGPYPPDQFRLGGHIAEGLSPKQYQLLNVLWPIGKQVTQQEALSAVYGSSPPDNPEKTLALLQKRTQKKLNEAGTLLWIEYEKAHFFLINTGERATNAHVG